MVRFFSSLDPHRRSSKMTHMTYNVAEAKAHFSELMQRALSGEEVVVAKDNKPLLKLVPLRTNGGRRIPGSAKGQILYIDDDFDATPPEFAEYVK